MQGRDKKGHFVSAPMSEEQKQKISNGQINRYISSRESGNYELPEKKQCSACKEWKLVKGNFVIQKRKLKSGRIAFYPQSRCNECNRKRLQEYRDNNKEKVRKQNREAERRRKTSASYRKKRQLYQREYGMMQRALNGANSRGPWSKNKKDLEKRLEMVDVEPFVQWWNSLGDRKPQEHELGEKLARAVRRAVTGEVQRMHLDLVDEIGVVAGEPSLYMDLYPT